METKEKESIAKKVGKVLSTIALPVVLGVGAVALIVKKMVDIENGNL